MTTRNFLFCMLALALFWAWLLGATIGEGSHGSGTATSAAASDEAIDGARRYLRGLFQTIHASHPDLADVDAGHFVARIRASTRALMQDEPARAAELDIQAPAAAWAKDAEDWARAVIPDHLGAGQLEGRVDFFAESMVLATEDPFTRLVIGDHFGNLGLLLRQFFPSSVGVFVEQDVEGLFLSIVVRGSGAEAAGLRAGDRVLALDGRDAADLSLRQARRLTAEGRCRLRLRRPGQTGVIDVEVYPTEFRGTQPIGFLVTPDVAYLRFTMFTGMVGVPLLTEARRLVGEGARAFVLDLRGNPGGAVSDAWVIADLFLDSGQTIVELEQRVSSEVELPTRLVSTSAAFGDEIPLLVLIDRSSASASELLGGALQDHRRAFLVGERSYGKGVGQSTMGRPLRNGDDVRTDTLALTCFRFNSPRGRNVHGVGLVPDLKVAPPAPPLEQTRAQAEMVASECLIAALREVVLSADEVEALRTRAPLPVAVRDLATACGLDATEGAHAEALREVSRLVLEPRHVELTACPQLDPVLDKALRTAEVLLSR